MRGRTNVGGGGLAINANAVNKIVKSGNIIAGDFVEYYSDPTYIHQGQPINFVFSIGDYDIAQIGESQNMLAAFKDGEQKFTYSGYDCRFIGKYENFILFVDTSLGVLGVLSVTSNGFTLVSSAQTADTYSASYYTGVAGGGNKVCYFTVNNSGYIKTGVADISNAGILSNFVKTQTQTSISSDSQYYRRLLYYYNGVFYGLQARYGRSYPITINNDNTPTIGNYVSFTSDFTNYRVVYQKDNIVVFAYYTKRGSSSGYEEYYQVYGSLSITNFVTGNAISKNLPNNGEILSYIKDGKFLMTGKTTMNNIAWGYQRSFHYYIPNMLCLCSFNDQTYEIVVLSSFTLPDDYTNPLSTSESGTHEYYYDLFLEEVPRNVAICDADLVYAQCKTIQYFSYTRTSSYSQTSYNTKDLNLYLYDIENNVLQETVDKDYVIPYHNGGHPIGVAKDPGTINSVIGVYIPVPVE